MVSYSNFYEGTNYGLDPNYGDFLGFSYRFPSSQFGLTTDPRSANQLSEVSKKISTGAKTIELTGITPNILESIPQQHMKEINRLRKLTGVDLTFHGPLIEATGITQQGWDEENRMQAERQIWSAINRSHDLDPNGNVVVTLHTTSGLPEMTTRVKEGKTEKIKEMYVFDSFGGNIQVIRPKDNPFLDEKGDANAALDKLNNETWQRQLTQASFHAQQGRESIVRAGAISEEESEGIKKTNFGELFKLSKKGEGQKILDTLSPTERQIADKVLSNMHYGEIYVRDAYNDLQRQFNSAWEAAQRDPKKNKDDIEKLKKFREEIKPQIQQFDDPAKIAQFADVVLKGVNTLNTLSTPPKAFIPLNEFAIDKASDTYAGLAFRSFKEFAHGRDKNTAPILSLENPPAGSGISRAEDMEILVKQSRDKFAQRAVDELGISEKEAKAQAEKLIGVTWDVGHINMLRKFGYDKDDIVKQTSKISPYVKHVHLSDNFGMEHTELPMGMGEVPVQKMIGEIKNKDAKKIIETGGPWFQFFGKSPLSETLQAFGSPIYSMKMSPYWNQAANSMGNYFSGYGNMLPDQHFSTYGAGFSSLPAELGGGIGGGRNRLSGSPLQ